LPSSHAHMPRHRRARRATVDDEIVPARLVEDRRFDRLLEEAVVRARSHRIAEVDRIILPQTRIERSLACHPDPVAAFAKIVGHRRDEAQPAAGLAYTDVAGWPAGVQ